MQKDEIKKYIKQLNLPKKDSHKGQNGKLLLIGGSQLFHAASKWSLDVASKIVDMVFYSSVLENNELIQKVKSDFWNGIVIQREDLEEYFQEADCILIGPGMQRNQDTQELVNLLLEKYPNKKFVVDAGALQMVNPNLLNKNCIITPHQMEMDRLLDSAKRQSINLDEKQITTILKGKIDKLSWFEAGKKMELEIEGGNEGMTKGGTGDVLAGIVAAFYCTNDASIAAVVGSYINKKAGDELYKSVGPFFNSSDLVDQVPKTLWQEVSK